MNEHRVSGLEARRLHGLLFASRWLIARRIAQLGFFMVFATGPWFGLWIAKGTLASSMTLDVLPLTDPFILLQGLVAGHAFHTQALIGAGIVLAVYVVIGGRTYCSWVCPINPITDLAAWCQRKLNIAKRRPLDRNMRYAGLGAALVTAFVTGTIAYELINPVTAIYRELLYGISWGFALVAAIFLFDLFVADKGWCGHLCPVGAFYGLLNTTALLRVSARGRERCDDCMDCYHVCPEMHVIAPALKGHKAGATPVILHRDCTSCGRCIDVCPERVFNFTHRFDIRCDEGSQIEVADQNFYTKSPT